jgi:hypothetical protein
VVEDITVWKPKIRGTGWFAGHDFHDEGWPDGVKPAVLQTMGKPHYRFIDSSWAFEMRKLA